MILDFLPSAKQDAAAARRDTVAAKRFLAKALRN
jgi:hypothetical protein